MTQRYERHGLTGTRIKNIWVQMIRRCYYTKDANYKNYGGRGVKVCKRWRESCRAFYDDMGDPPSPNHTLDRYPNNDGDYEPGNCRWATRRQQTRNTRTNRIITFDGESLTVAEWAEQLKMKVNTLYSRWRLGLSAEEILDPKPRHEHKGGKGPKKEERHGYRYQRAKGADQW